MFSNNASRFGLSIFNKLSSGFVAGCLFSWMIPNQIFTKMALFYYETFEEDDAPST